MVSKVDSEVFAAFTGPDGGITSISKTEEELRSLRAGNSYNAAENTEDYDCIDLDGLSSRRGSRKSSKDFDIRAAADAARNVADETGRDKEK